MFQLDLHYSVADDPHRLAPIHHVHGHRKGPVRRGLHRYAATPQTSSASRGNAAVNGPKRPVATRTTAERRVGPDEPDPWACSVPPPSAAFTAYLLLLATHATGRPQQPCQGDGAGKAALPVRRLHDAAGQDHVLYSSTKSCFAVLSSAKRAARRRFLADNPPLTGVFMENSMGLTIFAVGTRFALYSVSAD